MVVAMCGAVAIVAIVSMAVAALATLFAARAQAQVGADAAALAAAVATYPPTSGASPLGEARRIAGENGATLMSCVCRRDAVMRPRTVEVVTSVAADVPIFGKLNVRASSRAEFDPLRWLGP